MYGVTALGFRTETSLLVVVSSDTHLDGVGGKLKMKSELSNILWGILM